MGVIAQTARILSREGIRGMIGRARYTPLRSLLPVPAALRMERAFRLVDHDQPIYAAMIADILTARGLTALPPGDTGPATTWHIGVPPRALPGEIVVMPPDYPATATVPWRRVSRAALVLDHDPQRLLAFENPRPGRPRAMTLPSPLADRAALDRAMERVLILGGILPAATRDYKPELPSDPLPLLCLALPEHPTRLHSFAHAGLPGFQIVQGLRREPGWVGAASSYRQIARALLDEGRSAIICQDDAGPGPDFARRFAQAADYWKESGADLFSGIITDVDDSFRVTKVVHRGDMSFIHLNRSIGLVCSMFGPRALERLASWDERGQTARGGTIDRYLGDAPDLDVVTCVPFLVRHRDKLASSIWGFHNGRYNTLIDYSEKRLHRMALEFERGIVK